MIKDTPSRNEKRPSVCMQDHSPFDQIVEKISLLFLSMHEMKAVLHAEHNVVGQSVDPSLCAPLGVDAILQIADLSEQINGGELHHQIATHQEL